MAADPIMSILVLVGSILCNGLLSVALLATRFSMQRLLTDLANNTAATVENSKTTQDVRNELHTMRVELADKYAPLSSVTALVTQFADLDRNMRERLVRCEAGVQRSKELEEKYDKMLIATAKLETDIQYRFGPPLGNAR